MAYFKSNEPYPEDSYPAEENENEEEYDDGFDELNDEANPNCPRMNVRRSVNPDFVLRQAQEILWLLSAEHCLFCFC